MAFIIFEQRAEDPILPLHLFKEPIFTLSGVGLMIVGVGLFGVISFLPMFLQAVIGMSPTNSGETLIPLMLGLMLTVIVSGFLLKRTGYKVWLVAGPPVSALGLYLLSTLNMGSTQIEATIFSFVVGLGLGMVISNYLVAAQNCHVQERHGRCDIVPDPVPKPRSGDRGHFARFGHQQTDGGRTGKEPASRGRRCATGDRCQHAKRFAAQFHRCGADTDGHHRCDPALVEQQHDLHVPASGDDRLLRDRGQLFIKSLPLKSADEYHGMQPEEIISTSSNKKILIPTDGSKYSRSAIEHALDIAIRSNSEVTALNVIDTRKVTSTLEDLAPAPSDLLDDDIIRCRDGRSDQISEEDGRDHEDRGQDGRPCYRDQRAVR